MPRRTDPLPPSLSPAFAVVFRGIFFGAFPLRTMAAAHADWLGGSVQAIHVLGLDLIQRRKSPSKDVPVAAKSKRVVVKGAQPRARDDEMTPKEVARLKKVSYHAVYRAITSGELPERVEKAKKLTYHLIKRSAALAWIPREP